MKLTTQDKLVLEACDNDIIVCNITQKFTRRRNEAEKLVTKGVFKKTSDHYITRYTFA